MTHLYSELKKFRLKMYWEIRFLIFSRWCSRTCGEA